MQIDHIFIFTDHPIQMADALKSMGLSEGSNRIHVGQGTANRKFYFDNFFLEILWVHDTNEIMSDSLKKTGLWQRAGLDTPGFSPFGLCLVHTKDTDPVFEKGVAYQPSYFPEGMVIDIVKNEKGPSLPWTFRLPFKEPSTHATEPKNHDNGMKELTQAIFEYTKDDKTKFISHFEVPKQIQFEKTDRSWLTLIFDQGRQNRRQNFTALQLTICY